MAKEKLNLEKKVDSKEGKNEKENLEKMEGIVKVNVIHNGQEYKKGDKIEAKTKEEFDELKNNGVI